VLRRGRLLDAHRRVVDRQHPAQYSHLWITTQEVWFNPSATAGPEDGGWVKFPLSTPATVDLVTDSGGNLGSLVTGLKLGPGTYSQVRLIPVDAAAALTTSAKTAGALYNTEADYVDSASTTHHLPLELLNPDKGIGIQGSLKVPVGSVGAALAAVSTTTTGTTTTTTSNTTTPATSATKTTITSFANQLRRRARSHTVYLRRRDHPQRHPPELARQRLRSVRSRRNPGAADAH